MTLYENQKSTIKMGEKYDLTREVHYLHFDFRKRIITGLSTFPKDTKYRLPIFFINTQEKRRMPKAKAYWGERLREKYRAIRR